MTTDRDTIDALAAAWNDDGSSGAFWEPWHPQVGDRVRVHLSAECDTLFSGRLEPSSQRLLPRTHYPELDEAAGTVLEVASMAEVLTSSNGHRVYVCFDRKVAVPGGHVIGAVFAAAELVPLAPASPADGETWL